MEIAAQIYRGSMRGLKWGIIMTLVLGTLLIMVDKQVSMAKTANSVYAQAKIESTITD